LPVPDLIVYLQVPIAVLLDRVAKRKQSVEKKQKFNYLKILDNYNRYWIKKQPKEKVIVIDAHKHNFVENQDNIQALIAKIKSKLNYHYENNT